MRLRIRANWRIEHDGTVLDAGGEAAVDAVLAERLAAGGSAEILGPFEPDASTSSGGSLPEGAPAAPVPGGDSASSPAAVADAPPHAPVAEPDAEAAGASASTEALAADGGQVKPKASRKAG